MMLWPGKLWKISRSCPYDILIRVFYAENRDYPYAEGTMSSVHRLMDRQYIQNTQTILGSSVYQYQSAKGLEMRDSIRYQRSDPGNQPVANPHAEHW